jgi:hypothetical protein
MAWQTLDQQYKEQNTQNDRSNYLKDIIAGLSIAKNNDPMTLLGYALGRFGSNYVNRGLERRQQEKNTKGYDEWMQGVNKSAADAIPTVQGKAIPGQQNQNQQQLDILKGPSFVPEDVAREMTAGTPALQSAVDMQNAAPNTSPQVREIANQILGGQRQYAQNYDMTSDEVYNNAYRIARQNGSTETQARQFAQQKAAEYQPQRVNALSNAFIGGGVNPDGTINNQGVAMLAQLALEDPQQTNLLGNMYQTPQGATKYAQDIAKMMQNSNLQLNNQKEMANLNFEHQMQLAQAKMQMDEALRQGRQEEAYQMALALGKASGLSDQDAAREALAYVIGGGYGRSGNSRGGNTGGRSGNVAAQSGNNGQMKPSELKTMQEFYNNKLEDIDNRMMAFGENTNDPGYQQLKKARDYWQKQSDRLGKEDPVLNPADLNGATKILLDNGNSWDDIFKFFQVAKQQRDGSEKPLTAGEVMDAVRKNGGNEQDAARLIAALDIQDITAGENTEPIENNPVQEGNQLTDEELLRLASR